MRTFIGLPCGAVLYLGIAGIMPAPAVASSATIAGCDYGTDYGNGHYHAFCTDLDAAKADLHRRYPGADIGVKPSGVADYALVPDYYLYIDCKQNCDTTGLPDSP
jgi:hypothetical protein